MTALPSSPAPAHLAPRHLLLALAVMVVWGSNFVVIKYALAHLPPLLLATLRFTLAFVPLAFFLKRPAVSWGNLAAYGILIGAGQFGLLFIAMRSDITPGIASLVLQVQVFFTIALAVTINRERVQGYQIAALLLAVAGLGIIFGHATGAVTPLGLCLVLAGALSWAAGNMVNRAVGRVNMLAYVVWSSLFAVPPLAILTWIFEGPEAILHGLAIADRYTWASVVWQSVGNTMFGYGVWGWLMGRYPAATVTPMALLVPVFGLASSVLLLGEPLQNWKLLAAALVLSGLAVGIIWPRLKRRTLAM